MPETQKPKLDFSQIVATILVSIFTFIIFQTTVNHESRISVVESNISHIMESLCELKEMVKQKI